MFQIQTVTPNLQPLEKWALSAVCNDVGIEVDTSEFSPFAETLYNTLKSAAPVYRWQLLEARVGSRIMNAIAATDPFVKPQSSRITGHLIPADALITLPYPQVALDSYPIYSHCLNMLVGASGTGKSFIALDIAGRFALQGAKVIYIAGEGLYGYSARWECWKADHGKNAVPGVIFYDHPINLSDDKARTAFQSEIATHKPALVIVDTVATCMGSGDENSTRDMNAFLNACKSIQFGIGTGILLVHHTGKDGTTRGSSALYAACDSVMMLQAQDNRITIYNSREQGGKNKYGPAADPIHLILSPKSVMVGEKTFESCTLTRGKMMTIDLNESMLTTSQKLILEALEPYEGGMTASTLCDATGIKQATLYRYLKDMKTAGLITVEQDRYFCSEAGRDALR